VRDLLGQWATFPSDLIYHSIPSAQVEVLLPPLGSWKSRLLGQVENQRDISGQRDAPAS
jgi:hypothetical protein